MLASLVVAVRVTWIDGELWHGTWEGDESDLRRVDPRTGEVLERLEMPPGVAVSGLESELVAQLRLELLRAHLVVAVGRNATVLALLGEGAALRDRPRASHSQLAGLPLDSSLGGEI